jgi:hypothetical protein
MSLAPRSLVIPILTAEQKKVRSFLSALAEVERIGASDIGFGIQKEESSLLRGDIRSLRRILDIFAPGIKAKMEVPIVGETAESLREKRSLHLCAAAMVLRDYAASQGSVEATPSATDESLDFRRNRQRVLLFGLALISLAAGLYAFSEDRSPSLSWLILIGVLWFCAVWLWPSVLSENKKTSLSKMFRALNGLIVFLGTALMWLGGGFLILAFLILPGEGSVKSEAWGKLLLAGVGFLLGAALYFGWPRLTRFLVDFVRRY